MLAVLRDLGWDVEGVDFDPASVGLARSRGLKVHNGNLEDQHLPGASFDAVVMSHLVEHVPDPGRLFGECRRLLRPGGRLVMSTPNADSLAHSLYRASWVALDPPRHLHIFTPKSLCRLVEDAGFECVKWFTTIRAANFVFAASNAIRRTGRYGGAAAVGRVRNLSATAMQGHVQSGGVDSPRT